MKFSYDEKDRLEEVVFSNENNPSKDEIDIVNNFLISKLKHDSEDLQKGYDKIVEGIIGLCNFVGDYQLSKNQKSDERFEDMDLSYSQED